MSTSHTTFRRRVRRGALALMVGATLVPASSALAQGDTKYDLPGTPVPTKSGDTPADFPGMPGSPQTPAPVASHTQEVGGFDWTSAAIGAAGAGLLIVVALGGATAASRPPFRTMRS
jgi:hypothetical protein